MSALRPAALLGAVAVVCLCAGEETNGVSAELSREIGHALEEMHMTRRAPDDFISRRAFTNLLDACDARHMVFLAGDVAEFAKSRDKLDDMFKAGDFSFARRVRERYRMRLKECTAFATNALAGARHPVGNPSAYVFDRSHEPWPQDDAARDAIWSARLASEALVRPASSLVRSYADALETEMKRGEDAADEDFIMSVVSAYDAHTMYLSPKMRGLLEAQLKLSLCGVGAQWTAKDGGGVFTHIIPGGPLAKDGRVAAGDRLVAVSSNGDGAFTRVAGLGDLELVALFSGKEGTSISLEVEHADGRSEVVTVKRERIEVADLAASSQTVETPAGRLGYLRLPSFYVTAPSKGGAPRSSSEDVRRELRKLREAGVKGVLFDLRGNSGGSLDDAVKIIGMFVGGGPAVRMTGHAGEVALDVLGGVVECDTPLVVLVSRESASAGELVPATLQDTGRAVVVGDRTVGKGTAQSVVPLEALEGAALVVTEGRFYRITGGSTQLRGVEPDIALPCFASYWKGEEGLAHPVEWNEIAPVPFQKSWDMDRFVPELRTASMARRAAGSVAWKRHERLVGWAKECNERTSAPLAHDAHKAMRARDDAVDAESERLEREGFDPARRAADAALDEALNILADLVRLSAGRALPKPQADALDGSGLFEGLDDD